MKRPAFQFYPDKWQSDKALRTCSIGARGLWMEICCVMHTCAPYGHLTDAKGRATADKDAAQLCGVGLAAYRKLFAELDDKGVPSRTPAGIIFSRRMVRDERLREVRAEGGILGAEHGSKGGRPKTPKGSSKGLANNPLPNPLDTPPVFVSASVSVSQTGKAKPTRARASPVALPDWMPPEAWQQWAKHRGSKLTPQAVTLQLGKLDALRKLGHDPAELIALAIESGWATFYLPRAVAPQARQEARAKVAGDIWKGSDDARRDDDERTIDGEAKRVA